MWCLHCIFFSFVNQLSQSFVLVVRGGEVHTIMQNLNVAKGERADAHPGFSECKGPNFRKGANQ